VKKGKNEQKEIEDDEPPPPKKGEIIKQKGKSG
jgi:hypothetical protein